MMRYWKLIVGKPGLHRDLLMWYATGYTIVIKADFNHTPSAAFEPLTNVELLCLMKDPTVVVLQGKILPGGSDNWIEAEEWK